MSNTKNPTKVIIPCRFSFLHCWEPDSVNGSEPKYSVSAIIPKSDTATMNAIKAAIEVAKKESVSKWGGKIPPNLKLPLRDGDIDRRRMKLTRAATSSMPIAAKLRRWWTAAWTPFWIRVRCTPVATERSASTSTATTPMAIAALLLDLATFKS